MKKYVFLYAADIVLLADSTDLQVSLHCLHDWCGTNDMSINDDKRDIVLSRKTICSKFSF